MSGPKSSRYTLTAEQQKRIIEEQERLRRELEEKARKERECKETRVYLATIKTKVARHMEMIQENEEKLPSGGNDSLTLQERYQAIYSLIKQVNALCDTKSNATYATLMGVKKEVEMIFDKIVSIEGDLITETENIVLEKKIQEDSLIASGMTVSFEKVGIVERTEDPIFTETTLKLERLLSEELSEELFAEVSGALEKAKRIESISVMQNFSSITVAPLSKKCQEFVSFAKKNRAQYNAMLDKYEALCNQMGVQAKQMTFDEKGLSELDAAVMDLECQAAHDAEQAYISQSVDEVMVEMGYEVIGHRQVHKKSGKEFHSKLLTYEDGTVINVTESSNGQITMEVGGADEKDRLPDANERVALRKTMESFCRDFHEIEERLSARGVILNNRLSMAPPEEAYAQIINLNDYELAEEYQQTTMSKKKTSQTTSGKHMRDE